jgi:hypothetical protein
LAQLISSYGFVNDWAQSFAVPSGGTGQLYEHDFYQGRHWEMNQNSGGQDLSLIGASGIVSSVKIRTGVTFFQDANYQGQSTAPAGPQAGHCYTYNDLMAVYGFWHDWASSVMIPAGWTVQLYSQDNFYGNPWTLTQMDANSADFSRFGADNNVLSICVW